MVTGALRRVNLDKSKGPSLLDEISPDRFEILPNTAGCYSADAAITTARLGRELLGTDLIKLEVIGDERTLYPDADVTTEQGQTPASQRMPGARYDQRQGQPVETHEYLSPVLEQRPGVLRA